MIFSMHGSRYGCQNTTTQDTMMQNTMIQYTMMQDMRTKHTVTQCTTIQDTRTQDAVAKCKRIQDTIILTTYVRRFNTQKSKMQGFSIRWFRMPLLHTWCKSNTSTMTQDTTTRHTKTQDMMIQYAIVQGIPQTERAWQTSTTSFSGDRNTIKSATQITPPCASLDFIGNGQSTRIQRQTGSRCINSSSARHGK